MSTFHWRSPQPSFARPSFIGPTGSVAPVSLHFSGSASCARASQRDRFWMGWLRGAGLLSLFGFVFPVTIAATRYFVIAWSACRTLLAFHKNVILGSGLYWTRSQDVVEGEAVRRAIMAIPGDKSYAIPLALIAGGALLAAGLVTGFRNRQNVSSRQNDTVAIICIGAGIAALFSAIGVLKHYESHYTAGVSAALPACVVAGWLFMRAWPDKVRLAAVAVAWLGILMMAQFVVP